MKRQLNRKKIVFQPFGAMKIRLTCKRRKLDLSLYHIKILT